MTKIQERKLIYHVYKYITKSARWMKLEEIT